MSLYGLKWYLAFAQLALTLMFVAILPLMHMLPTLPPSWTATQIAAHYREYSTGILAGAVLIMFSSMMVATFSGILCCYIKKTEGEFTPITYSFLAISAWGWGSFFMSGIAFSVAAFRPENSDETIRVLSDLAIMLLIIPGIVQVLQSGLLAVATFNQKPGVEIFPRWYGYFNAFVAAVNIPAATVALFKIGPFAWNGVLGYWVELILFGPWFYTSMWVMYQATKREAAAHA